MKTFADADSFIQGHPEWQTILKKLRKLLLNCGLDESIKWGTPVYTFEGKNLVGLGAFKSYAGLWFFNGALLKDPKSVLLNAQEGKTKAMRQWRFSDASEIDPSLIESYLKEAIQLQRMGKVVAKAKPTATVEIPPELSQAFAKDKKLASMFAAFTPYKQKEFAEHISSAKQEKTRLNRLEKCIPLIQQGVGLHDKYRNC
jgi:uncharacterized protein YdeI (YjbR/CyaY-like superfamily)